jgi:hypothetical protein
LIVEKLAPELALLFTRQIEAKEDVEIKSKAAKRLENFIKKDLV